jgi:exonuclease SbcD
MKIAHLSDFHIGKRLEEIERNPEIRTVLDEIADRIQEEEVKAVLISGDIFESSRPSVPSLHLFYDFLKDLKKREVKKIFIIAGNHDNDALLEVARDFLEDSGIHIWGRASQSLDSYFYTAEVDGEKLFIAALPYLNEYQILSEIGKKEELLKKNYAERYIYTYRVLMEYFKKQAEKADGFRIFLGHLFAEKAVFSTSEREATLNQWLCVPIDLLEEKNPFDYIALGHIHKHQKISRLHPAYYAGSVIRMNFGEKNDEKGFYIVNTKTAEVRFHALKTPKILKETEMEISSLEELDALKAKKNGETLWKIRVYYSGDIPPIEIRQRIKEIFENEVKVEIISTRQKAYARERLRGIEKVQDLLDYYKEFKGETLKEQVLETLEGISREVMEN